MSCLYEEEINWGSTFCSGLHDQLELFGSILHPLGKLLGLQTTVTNFQIKPRLGSVAFSFTNLLKKNNLTYSSCMEKTRKVNKHKTKGLIEDKIAKELKGDGLSER